MTSIQVAVRIRPFNSRELKYCSSLIIDMKGQNTTEVYEVKGGKANTAMAPRKFNFDHCFWTHDRADAVIPELDPTTRDLVDSSVLKTESRIYADQEFVYRQLGVPILDNAMRGFNACLFAYGQTGSGKTYSMMGSPTDTGVIPRLCDELFARGAALEASGGSMTVSCTYMEIYNEVVRDLLNPTGIDKALKVRQHPTLGVYVQDLTKLSVANAQEIGRLLEDGGRVRAVAATNMNACSSRSHAILTLSVLLKDKEGNQFGSSLNLVDLAGSERAASTGAEGATLQEGASINKSLTTLGMCLSRLAESMDGKKNHIPYRDSQLTWVLNDSLGGNSKTAMLANISPASINYEETLSTLRFAMTVKKIKNNAVINEDPQQKLIRELRAEIEEIKLKILELEAGGGFDEMDEDGQDAADAAGDVLEELEAAERLYEEAVVSEAEKAKREAAAKVEHEKAMQVLHKSSVFVDNAMPRLLTLNEDLHAFPSVALLYYLRAGVNRVGCGNDKKSVLVRLPPECGKDKIQLFHNIIDVDPLGKLLTIRHALSSEQPDDMETTEEANMQLTMTARRGGGTRTHFSLAETLGNLNLSVVNAEELIAPTFINGRLLEPDAILSLKHNDRIIIGALAFRLSLPPSWYLEGFDDEFSREPDTTAHAALLESFERFNLHIKYQRGIEEYGKLVSMTAAASEESAKKLRGFLRTADQMRALAAEDLSTLMCDAAETENVLVELYPIGERELADRAATAAARDVGVEYDYTYAVNERDEYVRGLIVGRQKEEHDKHLQELQEKAQKSEEEIERLKRVLAESNRAKEEAIAKRLAKEADIARANTEKVRESTEKTTSMLLIANEMQAYEELVRQATMWKPSGPLPQLTEDVEEYKYSQTNPNFGAVLDEKAGDKALAMPPFTAYKMRLEHGVFGALRSGWHKVHILVRPRFVYYYTKNTPTTAAAGACYLYGCQLVVLPGLVEGKSHALRLIPCVPRKPSKSTKSETDDNNLLLAFESADDLQRLVQHVESVYRPACPPRVAEYLKQQDADGSQN